MRVLVQSIDDGVNARISSSYGADDSEYDDAKVLDDDHFAQTLPEDHQVDHRWNHQRQSRAAHSAHQRDE